MSLSPSAPDEISILVWATAGGVLVFLGLIIERVADWMNERFLGGYKPHKYLENWGWRILMAGIGIEVLVGGTTAIDDWQTKQIAKSNNPLLQPVSQVSAILLLRVDALTYSPGPLESFNHNLLNFNTGSITNLTTQTICDLGAIEGTYYKHTPIQPNGVIVVGGKEKIIAYTIALRFEQPAVQLPGFVPMDAYRTNDISDFPAISVTNALNAIKIAEAYIDFLPTNTIIIGGKAVLSLNGFRVDFYFDTNAICHEMNLYNPDRKGIFLQSNGKIHIE